MIKLASTFAHGALARIGFCVMWSGCTAATPSSQPERALVTRARAALVDVLEREEKFIKVHAAEILSSRGEKDRVRAIFERENARSGTVPGYRVGIWRVLAGAAADEIDRASRIARIGAVFMNSAATDRVVAIESLSKLGYRVHGDMLRAAEMMTETAPAADAMFAWWALHIAADSRAPGKLALGLSSTEQLVRLRAAYVIRWERIRDAETLAALARAAESEPTTTIGYAIILSAAVSLDANPEKTAEWRAALNEVLRNGSAGERYQVCLLLSEKFAAADLPRLTPLLDHEHGDVRVGAAAAILTILERAGQR